MLSSFYLKAFFFGAILKDFEFPVYCSLYKKDKGGDLILKGLQRPERFSPRTSHHSAFKIHSKKVERFTLLLVPSDRKSIQKAGAFWMDFRNQVERLFSRRQHSYFSVTHCENSEVQIAVFSKQSTLRE